MMYLQKLSAKLKKITWKEWLAIFSIVSLALFFKLYRLSDLMPFGWDQERDANVIWEMVKNHKFTLIGPRVVGPTGFYLGPLWYYLLAPFYLMNSLEPTGAGVMLAVTNAVTGVVLFEYLKKHTTKIISFVLTIVYVSLDDRTVYNPILVPLIVLTFLFLIEKMWQKPKIYIPLLWLLFGLSLQIHFILIFLLFPLVYENWRFVLRHKKKYSKTYLISFLLFLLTFSALILFDLRHDFINTHAFIKFFFDRSEAVSSLANPMIRMQTLLVDATAGYGALIPELQKSRGIIFGLMLVSISLTGIWLHTEKRVTKVALLTLIIFPLISFAFYKRSITQYYFQISWVSILVGCGLWVDLLIKKNKYLEKFLIIFALLLVFGRFQTLSKRYFAFNILEKNQVVNYILNNPRGEKDIFVSFKVPPGQDTGFRYLLKLRGNEAQDPSPNKSHYSVLIPIDYKLDPPDVGVGEMGIVRRD